MADVKAYLEREGGKRIPCRFNPSELQVTHSNNWSADAVPGREAPELVFSGGGSASMTRPSPPRAGLPGVHLMARIASFRHL